MQFTKKMTAVQEGSLLSPLLATPQSRRRWYRTFKVWSAKLERSPVAAILYT